MKYLFQNEGKPCLAKTAFTMTMVTCLSQIAYLSYTGGVIDYSGMSVLIGAVGAIYWGRSSTKAGKNV